MATHSSTLALKIPWTEELAAGYYPWGCKESGMTERLHLFHTGSVRVCSFLLQVQKESTTLLLTGFWTWVEVAT